MYRTISWLRRLYRKFPSRPFRKELAGFYYLYLRLTGGSVRAQVDSVTYDLDLRELIDSTIYFEGAWEPDMVAVLKRVMIPGQIAIDVGANMGYFTLLLAQLVGDTGKVIAFEPMSSAFVRLTRNLELNSLSNVIAEKVALSNAASEEMTSFATSWRLDLRAPMPPPELVTFETLDTYTKNHAELLPHIDLLKLDVDGHEEAVLRGAEITLRNQAPLILLEVGKGTEGSIRFLAELGYSFFSVPDTRLIGDIDVLENELPASIGKTINIMAKRLSSQEKNA